MRRTEELYSSGTLEGQLEIGEGCVLELHIEYPQFPRFPALSARYAAQARALARQVGQREVSVLRQLPLGCLGEHLRVEERFEIGYMQNGLLSLYIDRYEDMGLYKTGLGRRSDLWHLPDGRPAGLEALFWDPKAVQKLLTERIAGEIKAAPPAVYYGGWQQQKRWFFLTERGLCVYYRPGDITAQSGGIPTFLIPWCDLRPYAKIPL